MQSFPKRDIRNSIYDGMFANMYATLTGGVFLTGFALKLGMNEFMIGLLGSMPFWVTIFQLPASYLIIKNGRRKKTAHLFALLARVTWVPVLIVAVLPFSGGLSRTHVILGLIFLSYAFASISYISWLSWISDLVPEEGRGRFFGTRNMLCGAAGMMIMVIFGRLIDQFDTHSIGTLPTGFAITVVSAVLLGVISLRFLRRVSEPPQIQHPAEKVSFQEMIALPWREPNFRKLLIFALLWGFSVHFASPFFTLYYLRDLRFSYTFVATLGILSALADIMGMQIWGRISDRVKNKAVIRFAGWVVIFLPLAWITVRPESMILPMVLHILGGGFWAGINLCMTNLLLRISPQQNRSFSLSIYNFIGGLGAAVGPVLAGIVLVSITNLDLHFFSWKVLPLHIIFLTSGLLRILSYQIFKRVHEPGETPVGEVIRVIRSIRGLNIASGFNAIIHPFLSLEKEGVNIK